MGERLSRRDWLAVTGGMALDLLMARGAQGQPIAAPFDPRTPTELDRDWLKATARYAPERARLLRLVDEETGPPSVRRAQGINQNTGSGPFRPDWASLQTHKTPEWYQDAKFGIFIHWGLYSIPAFGSEWYSRDMYVQGSPEFAHHVRAYGPQNKFGYKDFIPRFTAQRFDPHVWMALFRDAGARYVVPVAEHHDGFSMYATRLSDFSAAKLGPRRDVLAEVKEAAQAHDLHFCLSSHRAEHDWFFDEGRKFASDVMDPANAGLYGPAQARITGPNSDDLFSDYTYVSQYWLDDWLARQAELVTVYEPELIYFDWWIGQPSFRNTLPKFLAFYYNRAAHAGRSAVVNYKLGEFAPGAGTLDIERGQAPRIRPDTWQTCTSISDKSWGYIENDTYKSPAQIVHLLADIVSKNGYLLLNVGPRGDGSIPEAAQGVLLAVGGWLKSNGEAIYGTRPWSKFGEGPTENADGSFSESKAKPYTARDFRFTTANGRLYAIQLAPPENGNATIASVRAAKSVSLLGPNAPLAFSQTADGLTITVPPDAPRSLANVYRIEI